MLDEIKVHLVCLHEFFYCCLVSQDKRLRSGDQILRIGDTDLAGMNSEQVAQVIYPFVDIYEARQWDTFFSSYIMMIFYVIDVKKNS